MLKPGPGLPADPYWPALLWQVQCNQNKDLGDYPSNHRQNLLRTSLLALPLRAGLPVCEDLGEQNNRGC